MVNLLNGLDIVFEVGDGVLPCSETLDENTGGLVYKRVSDICRVSVQDLARGLEAYAVGIELGNGHVIAGGACHCCLPRGHCRRVGGHDLRFLEKSLLLSRVKWKIMYVDICSTSKSRHS